MKKMSHAAGLTEGMEDVVEGGAEGEAVVEEEKSEAAGVDKEDEWPLDVEHPDRVYIRRCM